MQTLSRVAKTIGMVILLGLTIPVFAESAPVYDADSMQDSQDQNDLPLPPSPTPDEAYVPSQASAPAAGSSMSTSSMSMDQRMRRMEQQLNNLQAGDSQSRVDSLQSQVQTLRGQVEQLTHQIQQLESQQKTQYSDLDKRLSSNNAAPAASPQSMTEVGATDDAGTAPKASKKSAKVAKVTAVAPAADTLTPSDNSPDTTVAAKTVDQPNVAEEQQIYQTAYGLIKAKKYNEAVTALQGMLKKYPSGQFASNAHYWLGELYGLMGKNDQALDEFSTVVKTFPDSPRVSDAQLKVGLIYATQAKWSDAKNAFKRVINHYPGTASARLASDQLKQIKTAGH